jgi:hypothetical protein
MLLLNPSQVQNAEEPSFKKKHQQHLSYTASRTGIAFFTFSTQSRMFSTKLRAIPGLIPLPTKNSGF